MRMYSDLPYQQDGLTYVTCAICSDELEKGAGHRHFAVNWPIGCSKEFKVKQRLPENPCCWHDEQLLHRYQGSKNQIYEPDDPELEPMVGERLWVPAG